MSAVLPETTEEETPDAPPASAEFFIVMNQGSGSGEKDEVRQAIEQVLDGASRRYRFVDVQPGRILAACQQAARLAKDEHGILVAAGGDGTINCAAQAAFTHDVPMAVIAQGTFNLFARQLGLALEAAEATRMLLAARPEPVQVGWVNQRLFLVNASVGLYPKLLADREQVKHKLGRRRWIAMLAALKSLLEWHRQLVLEVELDGQLKQVRTASVFVCNNRVQLQRIGIADDIVAQVGEGRLAGVTVRSIDLWAKLRMMAYAMAGRLGDERGVDSFTLRTLSVGSRRVRRMTVATDGEVQKMQLPLRFTVAPRPLRVMLPPAEQRLPAE
ncbi:diacylglycerol kinase family protein [Ramlibacter sp. PS3R-8]|uniref:diacylglycerol/lipid kinase family protein n=1 Tax=Ramlibacter sp. PS3R-8 TaxID=3133437 RepID=UPI0030A17684